MSTHQMAIIIQTAEFDSFKPDQFEADPSLESLAQPDKLPIGKMSSVYSLSFRFFTLVIPN